MHLDFRYYSLFAIMCLMLQGCSAHRQKVDFPNFPSSVTFEYYEPSYKHVFKTQLSTNEPLFIVIEKWCRKNDSGWKNSYDTYAPVFLYRATNVTFNIRNDVVVANMRQRNGNWIQLIKPTPPNLMKKVSTLASEKLKLQMHPK